MLLFYIVACIVNSGDSVVGTAIVCKSDNFNGYKHVYFLRSTYMYITSLNTQDIKP